MKPAVFDKAYFDRFYFNPRTRVANRAYFDRLAAFAGAYLALLEVPVKRILDIGCGAGLLHPGLERAFPRAAIDACDASEYICRRYGWHHASIEQLEVVRQYDLVICHDVLQYLDGPATRRAIAKLARLTRGALLFGVLTREDWEQNCDQARTDSAVRLRSAAWYRRVLGASFRNAGGGVYLPRASAVVLYALESW